MRIVTIAKLSLVLLFLLLGCSSITTGLTYIISNAYSEAVFYKKTDEQIIALTVDDSPDSVTTAGILEVLSKYDAKATFFIITNNIKGNESLIEQMIEQGHEIGNHMTSDEPSYKLSESEFYQKFNEADSILSEYSGVRWFRPGSGFYTESMIAAMNAHDNEYLFALGSVYPFDPLIPSSSFASYYIIQNVKPGSIIILHDCGDRGQRTIKTLGNILPKLKKRGYKIVTLSELFNLRG